MEGGAWRLICAGVPKEFFLKNSDSENSDLEDQETQAEEVWNLLRSIHKNAPRLFSKPPVVKPFFHRNQSTIFCTTPDRRDEGRIRRAAEFIRSRVHFSSLMQYFENQPAPDRKQLFQHTPEGELYKYNEHGWKIVEDQSTSVDDNTPILPSEVIDANYLYMPSTEEGILNMKSEKAGKWMVFGPGNRMANHDATWLALLPLYRKGVLVGLKASTSVINPVNTVQVPGSFKRTNPVIHCYTADSEDKGDVLRAAVAIRGVVHNDYSMFYKSNDASIHGKYYHEGGKSVSKYQHTVEGGLYERDPLNRFVLIVPGKPNGNEV